MVKYKLNAVGPINVFESVTVFLMWFNGGSVAWRGGNSPESLAEPLL
jgi:hypothetical protein